ncbi:MAG: hypothetical protein Q7J34_12020 [Bacteroidales bacterium]|nr:hypothetical protein [Bacteroidales bacterium]
MYINRMFNMGLVGLFITIIACSSDQTPETVAKKFLEHLNACEYNAARDLGTESTKQYINLLESLGKGQDDANLSDKSIVIDQVEMDGDTAICYYSYDKTYESIRLVKYDKGWLVDIRKE